MAGSETERVADLSIVLHQFEKIIRKNMIDEQLAEMVRAVADRVEREHRSHDRAAIPMANNACAKTIRGQS